MAEIRVGTQGWTSPMLRKTQYPPRTRTGDYLKVLAQTLTDTVEVDGTFYNLPTADQVKEWYSATPSNFVFSVKMHKYITHEKRLVNVESETVEFLNIIRVLKDKLGPVLLQFAPDFHSGYFAPLEKYLPALPDDVHFAIEIRDQSWMQPRVVDRFMDLLTKFRIAFVLSDSWNVDYGERLTTDICYIRLNANDEWIAVEDAERVIRLRELELDRWSKLMLELAHKGVNVYCYVNDCFENNAAASVRSLQRRLGLKPGEIPRLFE